MEPIIALLTIVALWVLPDWLAWMVALGDKAAHGAIRELVIANQILSWNITPRTGTA